MSSIYILVGAPGSGKSTWLDDQFKRGFFNTDTHVVVSTDNLIEDKARFFGKTYNDVFKDSIDAAQKLADKQAVDALSEGKHVIWDQTNMTRKSRAKKLKMVPEGYGKFAVIFNAPPPEEHQRRLSSRPGKYIPKHIVENMLASYQEPTIDEGFGNVLVIAHNYGDMIDA